VRQVLTHPRWPIAATPPWRLSTEPALFEGYDPNKKLMLQQVALDRDMPPVEVSKEEAAQFKLQHGDHAEVYETAPGSGQWRVQLKKGATLYIPKALKFDRLVAGQVGGECDDAVSRARRILSLTRAAGPRARAFACFFFSPQIPTGWDARRYGIPEDLVRQVDPITLYVLVSTAEALLAAGITDPYELYHYVHVSEVGNTSGGGVGGMRANARMYRDRFLDRPVQSDVLQESFINTMPAWVNMLLLSSSGPIKTPVGACATAVESVELGVETILSGKAKVVVVGGYDDFQEEGAAACPRPRRAHGVVDTRTDAAFHPVLVGERQARTSLRRCAPRPTRWKSLRRAASRTKCHARRRRRAAASWSRRAPACRS